MHLLMSDNQSPRVNHSQYGVRKEDISSTVRSTFFHEAGNTGAIESPTKIPQISARRARLKVNISKIVEPSAAGTYEPTYEPYRLSQATTSSVDSQAQRMAFMATDLRFPEAHRISDEGGHRLTLYKLQKQVVLLQAQVDLPVIRSSEACQDLIEFVMRTKDGMVTARERSGDEKEFLGESSGCCLIA